MIILGCCRPWRIPIFFMGWVRWVEYFFAMLRLWILHSFWGIWSCHEPCREEWYPASDPNLAEQFSVLADSWLASSFGSFLIWPSDFRNVWGDCGAAFVSCLLLWGLVIILEHGGLYVDMDCPVWVQCLHGRLTVYMLYLPACWTAGLWVLTASRWFASCDIFLHRHVKCAFGNSWYRYRRWYRGFTWTKIKPSSSLMCFLCQMDFCQDATGFPSHHIFMETIPGNSPVENGPIFPWFYKVSAPCQGGCNPAKVGAFEVNNGLFAAKPRCPNEREGFVSSISRV